MEKPIVWEMGYILPLVKGSKRREREEKREREMRGTNILTDEKNKCFCCVRRAEVSHIANYDITVGVMAAAVAFVK